MKTLQVELEDRSYPIHIGEGLLDRPELVMPHVHGKQVMIVTNETIAPLYLDKALHLFQDYETATVILPDGEEYKNLETLNRVFTALLEKHFNRRCTLVALGGGVIGDITGFAAASYQRGVNFIQIPTTLLAQVDSSVGGKTGVNHPLGKNMIGAFHQPQCVLADTRTLNTLDDRQLSAGIAEVIKYGLINDPGFFTWLETNMPALLQRKPEALAYAVERSCADKAAVVAADEREAGMRALLNLGHTFGHAIETASGYGNWLHGEGVACGMFMAATLSCHQGWIDAAQLQRIKALIQQAGLPVLPPASMSLAQFLDIMAVDKKNIDKKIRLILMKDLGQCFISDNYDHALLQQTIEEMLTASQQA
ncbi:3-dehydroquinate synthase [Sulfuriflexus sp.]|uniref:3-dehydroquinate synthase n=1 Tax=Sulfuriflexus sp. TaxID=2015443 RepID=UPI0028CC094B|nr:3-dehydroquinate synthase [Sulfuriflexus sp.]MDT8403153.1 3-dehydroquinate synthase [Sulfuriflexus sp.]